MKKAAEIIKSQKSEILNLWEEEIKKEVSASRFPSRLALRDHLPHLLEDMNTVMLRYSNSKVVPEEETYEEIFQNSKEHGRHRSTSSGYTIDEILREYIIFHRILVSLLKSKGAYTVEVGTVIKFSIENAMLYSSKTFNESLQERRQKLIGILAHDLRNPISAALFAIEVMKPDGEKERFEKMQGMAQKSLKRAVGLLEGLLDSVTVGAGQGITLDFEEVDIMEEVKSIYEEATEMYSNTIELKTTEEEILGVFDATMIRRVLENFISNAIKYGDRTLPVTISVKDTAEIVSMSVHNYGKHIPEKKQQEIFHFLDTTNKSTQMKSWGMGLSLVKAIAEAHGGGLELISNETEGTTFKITLHKFENTPGKRRTAIRKA